MDEQMNPLERDHSLCVVLPGGLKKKAMVHGSKPVMDLLVTLCASYHLNPSDYTVEILSSNKNNISFKPNSPIGSLDADMIVLKPKGMEEKIRRPYMPEASVRLLINYNKSHKAVVRVNPRVPLEMLLPMVCDKCEFKLETTVLLRDSQCNEPLDLTKTLNEHGLREVFAKDTAGREPIDRQQQPNTPEAEVIAPAPLQGLSKKEKKQKENLGLLTLFRRRKNKPEMEGAASASASPGLNTQVRSSLNVQGVSSSNTLQADMPKKRRAPQPPMGASQSVPNKLSTCHLGTPQMSAELRSTKRRAPPPPCANTQQELQVKETLYSLNTVEELTESDESDSLNLSLYLSPSPRPSQLQSSSSSRPSFAYLHEVADPYLPSLQGKDLSDARCALAKVLTSSISKGTLIKRLRNTATFPKFYNSSVQRCSDKGVFCKEFESVLTSNLPTEPEWDDPIQRKGMSTFKVVPSKKQKSLDPELIPDVPGQMPVEENPESEASPEVGKNQNETEEDPCSPDRSETETPLLNPEPSSQEIQASDKTSLTPPLDLDDQDCPCSRLSEVGDTIEKQEEEKGPETTSLLNAESSSQEIQSSNRNPLTPPLDLDDQDCPCSSFSEVGDTIEKQKEEEGPETTPLLNPEPYSQEIQASNNTSLPPPLDFDDQDCPCSHFSEVGDTIEKQEEEGPETTTLLNPEPSSQEIQAPNRTSPSPPLDLDDHDCPGSLLSEVGDTIEKRMEEEGAEATSEMTLAAPPDCSKGEHLGDGQINSEDRSEFLQSPSGQSVSKDIDQRGLHTDEKEVEEKEVVQKEEEDSFPSPPPPVFFNEDIEVMEEGREDATASSQPQIATSNGKTNTFSEDHQNESPSAIPDQSAAAPKPLDKMSAAPSRFAQAVALALQKSHLQRHGKGLGPQVPSAPHNRLPSPPKSTYQYGA